MMIKISFVNKYNLMMIINNQYRKYLLLNFIKKSLDKLLMSYNLLLFMEKEERSEVVLNLTMLQKFMHITQFLLVFFDNNISEAKKYFQLLKKQQFDIKNLFIDLKDNFQSFNSKIKQQYPVQPEQNVNASSSHNNRSFEKKLMVILSQNLEQCNQDTITLKKYYQNLKEIQAKISNHREMQIQYFAQSTIQQVSKLYPEHQLKQFCADLGDSIISGSHQSLLSITNRMQLDKLIAIYEQFWKISMKENQIKLLRIKSINTQQTNKKHPEDIGKIKSIKINNKFRINHQKFTQKMIQLLQYAQSSPNQLDYLMFIAQRAEQSQKIYLYQQQQDNIIDVMDNKYIIIFHSLWFTFMLKIEELLQKITKRKIWPQIPKCSKIIAQTKGILQAKQLFVKQLENIFQQYIYAKLVPYSIEKTYVSAVKQRQGRKVLINLQNI